MRAGDDERQAEMRDGPDLGAVFDEHVSSELQAKDIDATMRTMIDEPYVWHVPALTGASGAEGVRRLLAVAEEPSSG